MLSNEVLHLTVTPLRSIESGELGDYAAKPGIESHRGRNKEIGNVSENLG